MGMLAYAEALDRVLAAVGPPVVERCEASSAVGRVLAAPVISAVHLPPFANSAMDGFALRAAGLEVAAGTELAVAGRVVAGDASADPGAERGGAWEIMTGAPVPAGLDSVVPVECVEVLARAADGRPTRVRLTDPVMPGQHVRLAGEDVVAGATVLKAGAALTPAGLMMLASIGVPRVPVYARPRVAVLSTGRELVDDPGRALADGEIRNSNGPYLSARLEAAGAEVVYRATLGDEVAPFVASVEAALEAGCRVLLSTGAVSMGVHDFVPDALERLGAQIVFHRVAIRPGKPVLFAVLPGGALFFGLPGNPVSAAVGLRFFAEPALRRLLGLPDERPLWAPLATSARKKPGFRLFQKARLGADACGRLSVSLLPGQESFKILPLAQANAWAVFPEEAAELPAGTRVAVYGPGHGLTPVIEPPQDGVERVNDGAGQEPGDEGCGC